MEAHGGPGGAALPRNDSIAPAWGAEVVSSNIVGYNKVTLTTGYNMLSPMFTYVGGGDKAIVDLFEEKEGFVGSDTASDADYFSIWYGGGYAYTYFYSTDAGDENVDAKWASGEDSFTETTDDLPPNTGFWFYNRAGQKTVTLAGEVPTNDVTVSVSAGYTMLANPFSAPLPVKSIVAVSGSFVGSDTASDADYISVWRNGGYDATYFYSTDAEGAWASGDDSFTETEDTIGPGEGFWFYSRNTSQITIKLPCPY